MKVRFFLFLAVFIASANQILLGDTSGDWTYSVSGSQATITGYSGVGGAVEIPALLDGVSVVKVGPEAFFNNTSITSITIPDSVTSIGEDAFRYCTSLASVTIGNSVTSIGEDAFRFCTSLTNITIPDSVTSIGDYAFAVCPRLTSITVDTGNLTYSSLDGVLFNKLQTLLIQYSIGKSNDSYTIPDSVTSIGEYAFYYGTNLTTITIPDSVTSIGKYAFFYCSNLTSITIPDSVTSIESNAFFSCRDLTSITVDADNSNYSSVEGRLFNKLQTSLILYPAGILDGSYTIPDSVTSIGGSAFTNCSNLASITIPDSVTSIGNGAFSSCSSLASVTIPDSVTSIGNYAFDTCTSLTSITIPDSVTSIGWYAFTNCSNLASITIPDSVTSIRNGAFYYCTSLASITIPDSVTSIGNGAFDSCTSLTSITIPDSVTSIGWYAFTNCSNLASITIPDSVTSIGGNAFSGCSSLTSVTLPATLFVEGNYSDYSLSAEQVRVEKASIDAFVANAETAARTTGRSDVTSDPGSYSLYTASDVSTAEAAARTIVNVSARVALGEDEIVTPGFVVLGESKQLLIRAVGPKLADLGVPSPLPNPKMTVYRTRYDGNPPDLVATIDDWKADNDNVAEIVAAMSSAGAFPLEPTETFQGSPFMTDDTSSAAALVTLDVGVYTVQVSSADDGVGEVLFEVYEITD